MASFSADGAIRFVAVSENGQLLEEAWNAMNHTVEIAELRRDVAELKDRVAELERLTNQFRPLTPEAVDEILDGLIAADRRKSKEE